MTSDKNNERTSIIKKIEAEINANIKILQEQLHKSIASSYKKVKISKDDENIATTGSDFAVKRAASELVFGKWLLDLPKLEKDSLLIFLIAREGLAYFFVEKILFSPFKEVVEIALNIITLLYLQKRDQLRSTDSHLVGTVRSRIYSKKIAGKSYREWDNFFLLLFRERIPYDKVLETFLSLANRGLVESWSVDRLVQEFGDWIIQKTIKSEEVIAPFYLTTRDFKIINSLLELGYEEGTTPKIAELLGISEGTTLRAFRKLTSKFNTVWWTMKNWKVLNLHNYVLKLHIPSRDSLEKLSREILKIPYIERIFAGKDDQSFILYSNFRCPHIASLILEEKCKDWSYRSEINDFILQLVRGGNLFNTVITKRFNPTTENFRRLLFNPSSFNLKKLTFWSWKKDFSLTYDEKNLMVDRNLLYFLSIIRNRYLVRARYGVWVEECYKLCEENNISTLDVSELMNFLNQLEIRARRLKLLTYRLGLTRDSLLSDVLALEVFVDDPFSEEVNELEEEMNIFGGMIITKIYDRLLISISGMNYDHPIAKLLAEFIRQKGFHLDLFTMRSKVWRFVPLHELYNFEEKRWKFESYFS